MILNIQKSRHRSEAGFTMVEMMVTIGIIGILAAISIPVFLNQRKVAVDSMVETDLRNAVVLIESWKNQNPDTKISSFILANTTGSTTATSGSTNVKGPMKEIKLSSGTTMWVWTGVRDTFDDTNPNPLTSYTVMARNNDGKSTGSAKGIQYSSLTGKYVCVNNSGGEIACE